MNVSEFIHRWQQSTVSERAAAQSHFRALCDLLGQLDPSRDPGGQDYAFEKRVTKLGGGQGFADVWQRGRFAWEYKGTHRNLVEAYKQLLTYRESAGRQRSRRHCPLSPSATPSSGTATRA